MTISASATTHWRRQPDVLESRLYDVARRSQPASRGGGGDHLRTRRELAAASSSATHDQRNDQRLGNDLDHL